MKIKESVFKMGRWHLLCLFVLCISYNFSQNQTKIDSLNALIAKAPEDSSKVLLYSELSRYYDLFKSKELLNNHLNALNLAKKINYTRGIKKEYVTVISVLFYRGVYDLAIAYHHDYEEFLKANNFNDDLLLSYNMYANILCREKKYSEAYRYYHLVRAFHASKNNETGLANVYNNLTILNLEVNQDDSALFYSGKALSIFTKNNSKSAMANSMVGIAEILIKKNDLETARSKAIEAYSIYEGIKERHGMCNSLFIQGMIFEKRKMIDSALIKTKSALALANELQITQLIRDCYLNISNLYDSKKDYQNAYENYKLYKMYNDSIATENLQGRMLEMEVKYDITKKEHDLKEKENELILKNKQRNYLVIIVIVVLIFLFIAYRAYAQKRKDNSIISEQKKLVEEKQKEILDSIKYAKRIQGALITNEKYFEKHLTKLQGKK